jgi:hypothetical protein
MSNAMTTPCRICGAAQPGLFRDPPICGYCDEALKSKSGDGTPKTTAFRGAIDVTVATAKVKLVQVAEEIVSLLASDPNATIRVVLEIDAEFPAGVSETIRRGVSENASSLGFKMKHWE